MAEHVKGQDKQKRFPEEEKVSGTRGRQNASGSRGGLNEMDDESLTVDRGTRVERGSGIKTKNSVTGSDFDGQVSE
ncbi:MAG TPA: hypothetical protein VFZ78_05710 [Flavisolibacter sp.]